MKRLVFSLLMIFAVSSILPQAANAAIPIKSDKTTTVQDDKSSNDQASQMSNAPQQVVEKKTTKQTWLKKLAHKAGDDKVVGALLAFFLGSFGVHRFYYGDKKFGMIMLGLTLIGMLLLIIGAVTAVGTVASGSGFGLGGGILYTIGGLIVTGVGIWAFVDFIRILIGSYPNN